ncbi:MAG: hypothetical protein U9O06_14830 [Euryarchaeota archaeon]|nr:hypothetical protein [Euryarchaeota archaeon]
MTDDHRPDEPGAAEEASDGESTDGSRIDEFLERFENDDPSAEPSAPPSDSEQATESGRLWDSFSSSRSSDADSDQPPVDGSPDRTTGAGETAGTRGIDDQLSEEVSADTSTAAEPTATDPATGSTAAAAETDPATTESSQSVESSESDSGTSFRSILKRISHRIGSVGSDAAADSTEADPATEEPTETGAATDERSERGRTARANTARGRTTSAESTPSETIDEILNNIDLFGRATSSSQVLLLSPTAHSITNDIYARFLLPNDGAGQNVLFVSATQSASDQLAAARNVPNWREGKTAVIEVGQSVLKPTRPDTEPDVTAQLDIYKGISNLQHLAKLGINISHIVSQWNNSRRPTVVGVHTLSAIQQYVGNETMFQFLFTLKGQLNSMGVMGFYHMDPKVHTENEIDTIQSAFDLVIEVGSDGSVDIL